MSDRDSVITSRSGNVIWRLYTDYATGGRRHAVVGTRETLVGRALGLLPAFVIGLAVDAILSK